MTTTAKIAAVTCKDTGVTPTIAAALWPKLKSRHMAIVELVVDKRGEADVDTKDITLAVETIEVATGAEAAEHLRELQRAIYTGRQADKTLTAGVEATPKDVVVRGQVEVLDCDRCHHSLGHERINHGRRDGVACLWTPCRHNVTDADTHAAKACVCGMRP